MSISESPAGNDDENPMATPSKDGGKIDKVATGRNKNLDQTVVPRARLYIAHRLEQLSKGASTEIAALLRSIADESTPNLEEGIQDALRVIYRGHEQYIPYVAPYLLDRKVINRLCYGDEGLFLSFLGQGTVLVVDKSSGKKAVWKIGKRPGRYDNATQKWCSIDEDSDGNSGYLDRLYRETEALEVLGPIGVSPQLIQRGDLMGSDGKPYPYFSTTFSPGSTLKNLFANHEQKTPPRLTADIGVLFAILLSKSHERGIIHRDISPRNLYVDDDGCPFILDWGLMHNINSSNSNDWALQGKPRGTPATMSPEMASGKASDATGSTDVFSLAALLYQLQTGKPLIERGTREEVIAALQNNELNLPEQMTYLPEGLAEILSDALNPDPQQRPNAMTLAENLYGSSSLYLRHNELAFGEFVEQFETLGRLTLPRHGKDNGTESDPLSRFAVRKGSRIKTYGDHDEESASAGTRMLQALCANRIL